MSKIIRNISLIPVTWSKNNQEDIDKNKRAVYQMLYSDIDELAETLLKKYLIIEDESGDKNYKKFYMKNDYVLWLALPIPKWVRKLLFKIKFI